MRECVLGIYIYMWKLALQVKNIYIYIVSTRYSPLIYIYICGDDECGDVIKKIEPPPKKKKKFRYSLNKNALEKEKHGHTANYLIISYMTFRQRTRPHSLEMSCWGNPFFFFFCVCRSWGATNTGIDR